MRGDQRKAGRNDVLPVDELTRARARRALDGARNAGMPTHASSSAVSCQASADGGPIVIRIEQVPAVAPPDELVAFPYGLEASAARKLEQDGHLKAVRIGRKKYTRRSDLLALVDVLPAVEPRKKKNGALDYDDLVLQTKSRSR